MTKEFFYTECCGKVVFEKEELKSKNILQVGKYKGTGKYYCPRCSQPVTKTGYNKTL